MAYKYNQLLKLNLQKDSTPDLSPIEAEIEDLRQHKVTKCFNAADLAALSDGEIFTWHGENTTDPAELENGFFYKKNVVPTTQQVLILYHNYPYIGGWYQNGVYYYQRSEETSLYMQSAVRNTDSQLMYWIGNSSPLVGTIITVGNDELTQTFVTIVSYAIVGGDVLYTDSAGDTWKIAGAVTGTPITFNYYTNSNNVTIITTNTSYDLTVSFVNQYDNNYYVTRWTNHSDTGAQFDTIHNPGGATFTQTNTQPPTPGVTVADGVIKISLPVEFSGNITVHGSEVVVTTEQIQSENDFIKLRYNNPLALAAGETSGISVNNYDGNDTDCILAVDKDGWARVGDSSGTLEKIATIEENPTDAQFVQYDAQNKQLKTAAIPEATTTTAGLMSSTDKVKLNNIDAQFIVYHQFNPLNATTIEEAIKKTVDNFFNANITTNILCYGTMFWQGMYRFEGYMYPFSVGICRFDFISILTNGVGYVGRYSAGWHFNS